MVLVSSRAIRILIALPAALIGAARCEAMVVAPAEFSEMVAASQTIVHGRVIDVRPYETAGRKTIETLVTVEVADAIKGSPAATVYFRLPGGQVGRYRRIMVGAPQCERGDELVIFLKGSAPAVPFPFGLTQGLYRVSRDGGGKATVTPLVAMGTERVVRGDPARQPLELTAFTTLVKSIAESRP